VSHRQGYFDGLKYCPSYFQKYINKDHEIRLTIIGENCYCSKIISEDNVDWRRQNNLVSYEAYSIPKKIEESCFALMKKLNLRFGCIDILNYNGQYHFLEINSNGQWLWLEQELNFPISDSILTELTC
jgi:glutathione synthase/RimK-type ligase-like ATP-grasp enzyme